jgi:D-alanyl-D-alanine dipeptidase
MKGRITALILIFAIALSGCCYAPGNERASFVEQWLKLPDMKMEDYQSMKEQTAQENIDPSAPDEDAAVIQSPVVNLEEMPDREPGDFVKVKDYIPDLVVELKYATAQNFTNRVVYDFTEAYLRYSTVLKLMDVQAELREQGLRLKIWDAFRPLKAQEKLWYAKPDPNYVSNPWNGTNSHSRGHTLDVTLVNAEGKELEMPTGFDEFSTYADRDYSDCTDAAAKNAMLLQEIMEKHGFTGLQSEWWHFTLADEPYPETYFDFPVSSRYLRR